MRLCQMNLCLGAEKTHTIRRKQRVTFPSQFHFRVLRMHSMPQLLNGEDDYYGRRSEKDPCNRAARTPRCPRSFITALALSSGIFGDDSAETLTRRGPAQGSGPHFSVSAKPAASSSSSTAPSSAVPSPTSVAPPPHHRGRSMAASSSNFALFSAGSLRIVCHPCSSAAASSNTA